MRKNRLLLLFMALLCTFGVQLHAKVIHLLPKPQQVTLSGGAPFALGRPVSVSSPWDCPYLTRFLTEEAKCSIEDGAAATITVTEGTVEGAYDFELAGYPNEAYSLEINENAINIVAVTSTGVIRAAQTLSQLAQGYDGAPELEALTMTDWPAFKLRGFMHDVGRSFMSVAELKKQIDALAHFKVNTFHWHFTENQAWRLQINAYPKLTEGQYMTRFPGQYYTQADCKDVQDYAAERGIMIIPEVDMPGHSEAFTRAMGHNMQTDEGVAELKVIIEEVCELFDKATYIHIGGDEVAITYENFLETMIAEVKKHGKEAMLWNPIRGVTIPELDAAMTQMWSTSGNKVPGKANIDCRYNYTNHFDVFADLVGIYKSNIYYQDQGTAEVPGFLSCPWNDKKMATEDDIIRQNNFYANVIASTERAWRGGGEQYIEVGGTMLPNSGAEFDEFADWERRFLFHKATTLSAEADLIPYVKQTHVRWMITDGFPNGGNPATAFPPETELKDMYTYNGTNYGTGIATGAGIYLSHTWPTVIPTYFGKNASEDQTSYAWTYVYSPEAQTVGALIEFQNYGRSEMNDKAPNAGEWDRKGSKIYLNGEEIPAPEWENPNGGSGAETELTNENFTGRLPVQLQLNAGWNKVFLKLPYVDASNIRLNKWMFTFVLTDTEGRNALDLIYSPYQCLDANAEQVAVKITEVRRSVYEKVGEKIGYYPASVVSDLLATLSEIEETLSAEKTDDERDALIATIESAKATYEASLAGASVILPTFSTEESVHYYSLKDKRGGKYVNSNGAGNGLTGSTGATGANLWKFVRRTESTFDIVNANDNSYLNPASAGNNSQLKTSATRPDAAWSLNFAGDGYVTITSGNVQLHQSQGENLLNWGGGSNTTDGGCLFLINEVVVPDGLPFTPTMVVNGEFAADTKWYTLQIASSKLNVTDNGTADHITLTNRSYNDDPELWCFVPNLDGSFKIYNKATGTGKVLAASTTMSGTTGSGTHPTLQPVDALPQGYVGSWVFEASDNISGVNGQYIRLNDSHQYAMNNRGGILAFWTGGADAGSTFTITPIEAETTISLATGTFNSGSGSYKNTWSSSEVSGLTFSTNANNMQPDCDDGTLISSYSGKDHSSTLTITAPAGWMIRSYSLDYALRSDNPTATETINGTTATTTPQTLQVDDCNAQTVSFTQAGNNKAVTFSNFKVVITKQVVLDKDGYEVLPAPYEGVVHRIPAIAQAKNGDIIAVADYRYSGADIGMATGEERRLDLNFRISSDYGKNWGEIETLVAGKGAPADNLNVNNLDVAFGDPCIVVDRESGKVLVMSCAGNVSYPNGTREKHQYIVTMYSEDNGRTWSEPVDVADAIYTKFDASTVGTPAAMFVGSGKISQSKYIKVNDYYRLYCAVLYKDVNGTEKNYVLYSDDFGVTWDVLGGVNVAPIPSGANEPKADELPDGSVVVSSRINGGRKFNIFHYTDPLAAEGSWGTVATSNSGNNGVVAESNSTNGEILTVPVKRVEDGKKMFLFLQSVPLGPSRANVGIYYKALESLADFDTPTDLAKDWDGYYQACYFASAYSTMTWLSNNTLGFLYEENINNSEYSIVYKNYTIEKLTGGAYEYCGDVDENAFLKESMDVRMAAADSHRGSYVGNLTTAGYLDIKEAYDAFMAAPSKALYAAFNKAEAEAQYRVLEAGTKYLVRNKYYPTKYLTIQASGVTAAVLDGEGSAAQQLTFSAGSAEGNWLVKGDGAWLGKTGENDENGVYVKTSEKEAVSYKVVSDPTGWSYFRCLEPDNASYPDLHINGSGNVVRWEYASAASQWYIELAEPTYADRIDAIFLDCMDELAPAGKVGYPALTNDKTTTFQEAFAAAEVALEAGTATQEDYDALAAARAAYKSETNVALPENGKVYTITAVNPSGTKAYLYYKNETDGYRLGQGDVIPETGYFICRTFDDDGVTKHVFTNTAGKYFVWKGASGENGNKGFVNTYNATYSPVWFKKQSDKWGAVYMVGKRPSGTATLVLNNALGETAFNANSGENGQVFSNSHTSALLIEEVPNFRNKITFTKLNDEEHYVATYSAPYPTLLPEGVKAYEVNTTTASTVETALLAEAGQAIPANTGVLLASTSALAPQPMAPATAETAQPASESNLLVGTNAASVVLDNVYILANAANGVGFYNVKNGSSLGSFRAYLNVPVTAEAKALRLSFGDEDGELTGIEEVETPSVRTQQIYDLSGRVVRTPQKGGLYLRGGKKFIQK